MMATHLCTDYLVQSINLGMISAEKTFFLYNCAPRCQRRSGLSGECSLDEFDAQHER